MSTRVGVGFDAHRFAVGRPLVLGGVTIEYPRGLAGHSDGDALSHAIVDALLGAAWIGDIGSHFPSSDPRWKDASSAVFLESAARSVREAGLAIGNVDATVICEEPRIAPHRETMEEFIAKALGVVARQIGVKATTTDGMGFAGRGDGIAALAVVMLEGP